MTNVEIRVERGRPKRSKHNTQVSTAPIWGLSRAVTSAALKGKNKSSKQTNLLRVEKPRNTHFVILQ